MHVVHRTLANLSKLPSDLVSLIEGYCQGRVPGKDSPKLAVTDGEIGMGPVYGPLAIARSIALSCGIEAALGPSRKAGLALFLVLARLLHRGSRLSATRWAEDQAVAAALGLGAFDEDDLYEALDWLAERQEAIELALVPKGAAAPTLCLYDVTSSYFEGQQNELAAPGYNRDGKKFKKQVVIGLLTDVSGEPLAVRVFKGNTSDPGTVATAIETLTRKLGIREVVFVGDRGMVKSKAREALGAIHFRWITALTDAQVRVLIRKGHIQLGLFEEAPVEVLVGDRRLILRRNPETVARDAQRRADQMEKVRAKMDLRNQDVEKKKRASPLASLHLAGTLLKKYRLDRFVEPVLEGRKVSFKIYEDRKADVSLLDGCYVIETNVPKESMDKDVVHTRYKDLANVERDFRTMKTTLLEVRPIFLRNAGRTRAHAFVTMLALKIARRLEAMVQPLGLTVEDAIERLKAVRLVSLGHPDLGFWRLPTHYAPAQREILDRLPPLPAPMLSLQRGHPPRNGRIPRTK
jgi:hypothetical protein